MKSEKLKLIHFKKKEAKSGGLVGENMLFFNCFSP